MFSVNITLPLFFFSIQLHIFNMSAKFKADCLSIVGEVNEATLIPFFRYNPNISKFKMAVIMSKIFFPFQKDKCTSSICLQKLCIVSD